MQTEQPASCASLLKVLADETRLAVIRRLMDGPKNVGQLNEGLGVEQTLLSHHLKVLRNAGLVDAQREGKAVRYSLTPHFKTQSRGEAIDLGCCKLSFD